MSMRIVHSVSSSCSQRYYNYLYSLCLCLELTRADDADIDLFRKMTKTQLNSKACALSNIRVHKNWLFTV